MRIPADLLQAIGQPADADLYQASMGIYVFTRNVLTECLDNSFADFGKNIIPAAIEKYKVQAYIFEGIGKTLEQSARSSRPVSTSPIPIPNSVSMRPELPSIRTRVSCLQASCGRPT